MNKLYIESVKASNDITPLDVYFILKVGEHCHFSNIITVTIILLYIFRFSNNNNYNNVIYVSHFNQEINN